jgi:hypothetical protein
MTDDKDDLHEPALGFVAGQHASRKAALRREIEAAMAAGTVPIRRLPPHRRTPAHKIKRRA